MIFDTAGLQARLFNFSLVKATKETNIQVTDMLLLGASGIILHNVPSPISRSSADCSRFHMERQ